MSLSDRWSLSFGDARADPDRWPRRAREILTCPVDVLLASGGDHRAIPHLGRNSYGFPVVDPRPLVRGSSCTTTPPDEVAIDALVRWQRRSLTRLERAVTLEPIDAWRAEIVEPLLRHLRLDAENTRRVVLTPSGTDTEPLLTALTLTSTDRPLRNILVGSLEAGSGTKLAAAGRVFSAQTPFRSAVSVGEPLAEFAVDRVSIVDVEVRDGSGRPRRAFDVEAEVEAHIEDAIDCGERVLVHGMAGSKTGLTQLEPAWIRAWSSKHRDIRTVVDAAQCRVSVRDVAAYLDAGAAVALTGSKAWSGPPFSGAVLLSDALLADAKAALERGARLPQGLRDFLSTTDLPPQLRELLPDCEPVNLGLLARWIVAIDEVDRLEAVPAADRTSFVRELMAGLQTRLPRLPRVRVLPTPVSSTIVSFGVVDSTDELFDKGGAVEFYRTLVGQPGVHVGQPVELSPRGPAVLRFAVGATTITRALMTGEPPTQAAARVVETFVDVLDRALPRHRTNVAPLP